MSKKNAFPFLMVILVAGTFLRFYRLGDLMQFGGDQGRDAFAARDIATLTDLRLVGPPSTTHGDLDSGPAYYYLLAIFAKAFNFAPEAGGVAVAFFGVCSILLFYLLTRKFFDQGLSLAITLLYTVSNVVVFYQRFPWNPNLLLFFVLVFWLGLLGWLGRERGDEVNKEDWRDMILMAVGFGLGVQMHFTALILLPAAVLTLLVVERRRLFSKKYLLPAFCFLLLASFLHLPYLIYQWQHRFPVVRALAKIFLLFTGQAQAAEGIAKTPYLEQVGQNLGRLTTFVSKLLFTTESQILGGLVLLGILAGVIRVMGEIRGKKEIRENKEILILGNWLTTSILIYAFYPKGLDEHYFLQMAPAVFLGLGVVIRVIREIGMLGRVGGIGIVGVLLTINLYRLTQDFSRLTKGEYLPRYGITLAEARQVADFIYENRPTEPFSVQMFGESRALSPVGYHYLLSLKGLKPNQDFLDSYRQVDYVFYLVEPKFFLEDSKNATELDARIGHIHEKLAQEEIGNVKVVYAKRPHTIFDQ